MDARPGDPVVSRFPCFRSMNEIVDELGRVVAEADARRCSAEDSHGFRCNLERGHAEAELFFGPDGPGPHDFGWLRIR